jgi:hypothetical protein
MNYLINLRFSGRKLHFTYNALGWGHALSQFCALRTRAVLYVREGMSRPPAGGRLEEPTVMAAWWLLSAPCRRGRPSPVGR